LVFIQSNGHQGDADGLQTEPDEGPVESYETFGEVVNQGKCLAPKVGTKDNDVDGDDNVEESGDSVVLKKGRK